MRKIDVMFAIEDLEVGGAEMVVRTLAAGLDRNKFRVRVACLQKAGAMGGELAPLVDGFYVLGKKSTVDPQMLVRFVRLLRRTGTKILNTHLVTANTWGRIAGLAARTPVVVATEHSVDKWKTSAHRLADKALSPACTRMVAVSRAVADFYEKEIGLPPWKIEVIENGIDVDKWKPAQSRTDARRRFGIPPRARVICTVGRLIPDKNQSSIIELAAALGLHVIIAGEGPLAGGLDATAKRLGISERVHLPGLVRDVRPVLDASDVFALPSHREGMSITLIEAMAAGKPVVVSDAGGNRELVEDGVSGLVFPAGADGAFAAAVKRIFADAPLAGKLARNAASRARNRFGARRMIEQTEELFVRLLEGRRLP